MGELVVSSSPGDVLVALGLGSCIGLSLFDRRRGLAGLAHVVLPDSGAHRSSDAGKYADTAVPALVAGLVGHGASASSLEAVLVGGAQMFSFGRSEALDVGARNETAVLAALAAARIPVRTAETGGTKGRTVRLHVEGCKVTVKEAGGKEVVLFGANSTAVRTTTERAAA